jgi:hypothetical protein
VPKGYKSGDNFQEGVREISETFMGSVITGRLRNYDLWVPKVFDNLRIIFSRNLAELIN